MTSKNLIPLQVLDGPVLGAITPCDVTWPENDFEVALVISKLPQLCKRHGQAVVDAKHANEAIPVTVNLMQRRYERKRSINIRPNLVGEPGSVKLLPINVLDDLGRFAFIRGSDDDVSTRISIEHRDGILDEIKLIAFLAQVERLLEI